jgi:hypothetical protein
VFYLKGLGKCRVGVAHSHERLKVDKGNRWMMCGLLKWYGGLAAGVLFAYWV